MGWNEFEDVRIALSELGRSQPLNPASLGPALRPMLESGHWRDWVHPVTGVRHFDDFDGFVEHETHHRVDVILVTLCADNRFDDVVEKIEQARRDVPEIAKKPGPNPNRNLRVTKNSDTDDYVVSRLKRDAPALAQQVVAGELSAHAAAVQAGIRRPRTSIRTDDVDRAVGKLAEYYTLEEIRLALKRIEP